MYLGCQSLIKPPLSKGLFKGRLFNSQKNPDVFLDVFTDEKGEFKIKADTGDAFSLEIWVEGECIHKDNLIVSSEATKAGSLVYDFSLAWAKKD